MPVCVILNSRYPDFSIECSVLERLGVEVIPRFSFRDISADRLDEAMVIEAVGNADAVLVNLAPFSARVIDALPGLKVISRYGVGLDNIDTAHAKSKGIRVMNVPDYCTTEVAEHTIALMLDLLRGITGRDSAVKSGQWNQKEAQHTLKDQTLGIIGCGSIARSVIERCIPFAPERILVYSRHAHSGTAYSASIEAAESNTCTQESRIRTLSSLFHVPLEFVNLDQLIESSSIISLHCSLTNETKHLLDAPKFARMRKGVFIINTARGALIDFTALLQAVQSGIVAGVGLDVFEQEPPDDILELLQHPAFLVTDHTAFRSIHSIEELKRRCAENAARGLGLM